MGRAIKFRHPEVKRVLETDFDLTDFPRHGKFREARMANPYKVGDVIRVENGVEALVVEVFVERINEADPYSDYLPIVRACEKKKDGEWSRLWRKVWPGEIERGFKALKESAQKSGS